MPFDWSRYPECPIAWTPGLRVRNGLVSPVEEPAEESEATPAIPTGAPELLPEAHQVLPLPTPQVQSAALTSEMPQETVTAANGPGAFQPASSASDTDTGKVAAPAQPQQSEGSLELPGVAENLPGSAKNAENKDSANQDQENEDPISSPAQDSGENQRPVPSARPRGRRAKKALRRLLI